MTFYLRDSKSGLLLPRDLRSTVLRPAVAGASGRSLSAGFQLIPPTPESRATTQFGYGNLITRGDSTDSYHESFAVLGVPDVRHAVPIRSSLQDAGVMPATPQGVPITAVHHMFLTTNSNSAANTSGEWNLTSYGGHRGAAWNASAASTINSRVQTHNPVF